MPHFKKFSQEQIENNKYIYNEIFDKEYAKDLATHILSKMDKYYFRSRLIGFENYPERNNPERPLLFLSNHSGMAFPWDAIIFVSRIYTSSQGDLKKAVRALTAPMLSQSVLMNPFLTDNFWKKAGGIDATFLNFETMMQNRESNLLMYPEGVPGIGKSFTKRYQLQRFSTSSIKMSIKYKTDIISVLTVNGEYINPYNLKSVLLNRLSQKIGIPFIPVGLMSLLIPFQPWIFYFGFPAKLTYVMGSRIKPYEMIDKPFEEITTKEFRDISNKVKAIMQNELNEAVEKYGKVRYKPRELFSIWRKNLKYFPFFLPFCWPSIFEEFDLQFRQKGIVSSFKMKVLSIITIVRHNPIIIAFFIPILGWIPILIKGMRPKI